MRPLITVAELSERPGPLVVFDVRFELQDPQAGRKSYEAGSIPGAVFADLNLDLSSPVIAGQTGRHPLPDLAQLAVFLGNHGVNASTHVVVYDQDVGAFAARLWWLLRYLGHDSVQVLDGGFSAWKKSGLTELRAFGPERSAPKTTAIFRPEPRPEMVASLVEVEEASLGGSLLLLDARAADRFRGENEGIDPRPGHIPRARSFPFSSNLKDGKLETTPELEARWDRALGSRPPHEAIAYCGSGVTACHLLLSAELAGKKGVRLFPGSYSEWICDPERPVAVGAE